MLLRQTEVEGEVAALETRLTELDKLMYSGTITASRDLQAMADEVEHLKRRRSTLEDHILEAMDAWVSIPFMMILLLAGLQALPKEITEAAKVDGAGPWQGFWKITFPLMLPVSITAIVLRIIFKLKLADIVITTTSGGPGGATDTVSSFIYREYRDRSNVGYGTMLAMVYLILIIVFVTLLLKFVSGRMQKMT